MVSLAKVMYLNGIVSSILKMCGVFFSLISWSVNRKAESNRRERKPEVPRRWVADHAHVRSAWKAAIYISHVSVFLRSDNLKRLLLSLTKVFKTAFSGRCFVKLITGYPQPRPLLLAVTCAANAFIGKGKILRHTANRCWHLNWDNSSLSTFRRSLLRFMNKLSVKATKERTAVMPTNTVLNNEESCNCLQLEHRPVILLSWK